MSHRWRSVTVNGDPQFTGKSCGQCQRIAAHWAGRYLGYTIVGSRRWTTAPLPECRTHRSAAEVTRGGYAWEEFVRTTLGPGRAVPALAAALEVVMGAAEGAYARRHLAYGFGTVTVNGLQKPYARSRDETLEAMVARDLLSATGDYSRLALDELVGLAALGRSAIATAEALYWAACAEVGARPGPEVPWSGRYSVWPTSIAYRDVRGRPLTANGYWTADHERAVPVTDGLKPAQDLWSLGVCFYGSSEYPVSGHWAHPVGFGGSLRTAPVDGERQEFPILALLT